MARWNGMDFDEPVPQGPRHPALPAGGLHRREGDRGLRDASRSTASAWPAGPRAAAADLPGRAAPRHAAPGRPGGRRRHPQLAGGRGRAKAVAEVKEGGGAGKEIVARIFVIPTEDADVARTVGRRMITAYLNVEAYAEFHRWLGRGPALQPMWDAWAAGDRKGALGRHPRRGGRRARRPRSRPSAGPHIQRYMDNGVTVPALAVVPFGVDLADVVAGLSPPRNEAAAGRDHGIRPCDGLPHHLPRRLARPVRAEESAPASWPRHALDRIDAPRPDLQRLRGDRRRAGTRRGRRHRRDGRQRRRPRAPGRHPDRREGPRRTPPATAPPSARPSGRRPAGHAPTSPSWPGCGRPGCVVVGKTNTPEFAWSANTTNAVFGPTREPLEPGARPGRLLGRRRGRSRRRHGAAGHRL